MTESQNLSSEETRSYLWSYMIISSAVAIMALFFPTSKDQLQSAELGAVWDRPTLTADREIVLNENAMLSEDEIRAQHRPIYVKDHQIFERSALQLERQLPLVTTDMTPSDYASLEKTISDLLKAMGKSLVITALPESNVISVKSGDKSSYVSMENLLTVEAAQVKFSEQLKAKGLEQYFDAVKNLIKENLKYDAAQNDQAIAEKLASNRKASVISPGTVIIAKGQVVTPEKYAFLEAYNAGQSPYGFFKVSNWWRFFGYLLLTSLILSIFLVYLGNHDPMILHKPTRLIFMMLWPVLFGALVYFIERSGAVSSYIIPFCIVPIIVRSFTNSRLALFTHVVVVLIASFLSKQGYEFTFLQMLAGIVAVLFVKETRDWSEFFMSLLLILLSYCLGYFGVSLIQDGSLAGLEWKNYLWFFLNVFLTLLAYPLIPLIERLFGFTTSIKLTELADLNRPLLKDLSIKAPGTLQHSLQVSNLCQAAAEKIGANVQLIKVGALYHDIGKLHDPPCFIENQSGHNPHESKNNFESARAIIDHVIEGEKMAVKAKLPKDIIDFIRTHHGTTRVEYFYRNQLNQHPDKEFDETLFRYPGPNPWTKEQTIMMMADSLEAASKSLKNATGQDIDNLVDKIIDGKLKAGQLDDSPLSFSELEKCKGVFKSMLRSINHVRVEYPEEKKP